MPAVFVAARDEMEQVVVVQQPQLRQQLGVLRPDAGDVRKRDGVGGWVRHDGKISPIIAQNRDEGRLFRR